MGPPVYDFMALELEVEASAPSFSCGCWRLKSGPFIFMADHLLVGHLFCAVRLVSLRSTITDLRLSHLLIIMLLVNADLRLTLRFDSPQGYCPQKLAIVSSWDSIPSLWIWITICAFLLMRHLDAVSKASSGQDQKGWEGESGALRAYGVRQERSLQMKSVHFTSRFH